MSRRDDDVSKARSSARFAQRHWDRLWAMDILVANRQRRVPFDLAWVRRAAVAAYTKCLPHSGDEKFALRGIPGVEVAVVSDQTIARVHE